jgi:hypothetical protein
MLSAVSGGRGFSNDVKGLSQDDPVFQELLTRVDAIAGTIGYLQSDCKGFVVKEEVTEALKAIVLEIKSLRKNTVTHIVFNEKLKLKCDSIEMERLVKNLADVLGDINLTSNEVAAFHSKCLICDKPVTASANKRDRSKTAPSSGAGGVSTSKSLSYLPSVTVSEDRRERVGNSSPPSRGASRGMNRVTAEMAVIRTALEPLPDINVCSFSIILSQLVFWLLVVCVVGFFGVI